MSTKPDLLVLSHLRWNFVFQRPQHLMTRFAKERRVFFFEEPIYEGNEVRLSVERSKEGVIVATPHMPAGLNHKAVMDAERACLEQLIAEHGIHHFDSWYYTAMALDFTRHLQPRAIAYDCMDELTMFAGAPPILIELERELLSRADVVFTGGHSLYEAKRMRHPNCHAFPSSVDVKHFGQARREMTEPKDQAAIAHPRVGFFGVVDERMDLALLDGLAAARPDLQFVVIGPVVKIDASALPRHPNLHWLGGKKYDELPAYLHGWDVAMMPFARNDATRFISPTKTPEFLAAGQPVVSTTIRDVVRPYGVKGLVEISDDVPSFSAAIDRCLTRGADERRAWLSRVDDHLASMSWDITFTGMRELLERAGERNEAARSNDAEATGAEA